MKTLVPPSVTSCPGGHPPDNGSGVPDCVVAIGTSAGGLAALRAVLAAIPPEFPVAIVIVQHLAASPPSLLSAILAPHARRSWCKR